MNPTDTNEKVVQTNDDFYIDDIVIWRVDDASQLTPELPREENPTTPETPGGEDTTAPTENDTTTSADTTATSGKTTTSTSADSDVASDVQDEDAGGLSVGAIVGIVAAAVVVLGGGGFALYWFKFRKK